MIGGFIGFGIWKIQLVSFCFPPLGSFVDYYFLFFFDLSMFSLPDYGRSFFNGNSLWKKIFLFELAYDISRTWQLASIKYL